MPEFDAPRKRKKPIKNKAPEERKPVAKPREQPQEPLREPPAPQKKRKRPAEKNTKAETAKSRRKRKKNLVIYYFVLIIFTVAVVGILSVTVLFRIDRVVLEGDAVYSEDEIKEAGEIPLGENLLRFDTKAVEARLLDKLLNIDAVTVDKGFPNALNIKLTAAVPLVDILYEGKYLLISEKGKILSVSAAPSEKVPVVIGITPSSTEAGRFIEESNTDNVEADVEINKRLELMYGIAEKLIELDFPEITEIDLTERLDVYLSYSGRVSISLGTVAELEDKLTVARAIISAQIGEHEKCRLIVSDPQRAVVLPIYEETEPPTDTEAPTDEETPESAPEDGETPPEEEAPVE